MSNTGLEEESPWSNIDDVVKLNVGGQLFETTIGTLRSVDKTATFFNALFSGKWKNDNDKPVFIDRDGSLFRFVLEFLRNGVVELQGLSEPTLRNVKREFDFFGLAPRTVYEEVYVFGGAGYGNGQKSSIYRLDPQVQRWKQGVDMPQHCSHAACASITGNSPSVLVCGGYANASVGGYINPYPQSTLQRLDVEGGTWHTLAPLPAPRARHHACMVDEKLYVVGGETYNNEEKKFEINCSVAIYDPITNEWGDGPRMMEKRRDFGMANIGSMIYLVGGLMGEDVAAGATLALDTTTGEWSEMAPLLLPRYKATVVAHGGYLFAIGGKDSQFHISNNSILEKKVKQVERFDPKFRNARGKTVGQWVRLVDMPVLVTSFASGSFAPSLGTGTGTGANHLFIAGGNDSEMEPTVGVHMLNSDKGTWEVAPDLPAMHSGFCGCTVVRETCAFSRALALLRV